MDEIVIAKRKCSSCGNLMFSHKKEVKSFQVGNSEITLGNLSLSRCPSCGEECISEHSAMRIFEALKPEFDFQENKQKEAENELEIKPADIREIQQVSKIRFEQKRKLEENKIKLYLNVRIRDAAERGLFETSIGKDELSGLSSFFTIEDVIKSFEEAGFHIVKEYGERKNLLYFHFYWKPKD